MHERPVNSKIEKLKKAVKAIEQGKKAGRLRDMNYVQGIAFLSDFRTYATAVCSAVGHHMQPTASNVHSDKNISDWEAMTGVLHLLEKIDAVGIRPGKDGNHKKKSAFFKHAAPLYRDVAEQLTKISSDFDPAYNSPDMNIPARFRRISGETPVMTPKEIVQYFDRYVLYRERRAYNRLPEFTPNAG